MSTNICSWRLDDDIDRDARWELKLFGIRLKGFGRKPPIRISRCRNFLVHVDQDFRIIVNNIVTRKEYAIFSFHQAWISDICLSIEQNALIAGSFDKTVSIWNFKEKSLRSQFECKSFVSCVEISNISGKIIAGCTDMNFYIYSNDENIQIVKNIHKSYPFFIKMLDNDRIVSVGSDNFVVFWNSDMQKGRVEVWFQKNQILSVNFMPQYYIIGFSDFNFRVFKLS